MLKRLICLIGALVGAAGLSQAPEYTQQYAQRLAGAVDELTAVADQFDADAASMGLTRQEGLGRYGASADGFLVGRGLAMQTVFERHAQLSAQLAQLRAASPATRLFELSRSFDTDVGKAALEDFRPAMPLTAEGIAHALAGLGIGFAAFWLIVTLVAAPFRSRRPKVRVSRIAPRP